MNVLPSHPRPRHQRGIALIEALIGILIFAFGVLGLVGLQASMTRAQTGSKLRGDATYLASELMGIIWTDTQNVVKYGDCANYDRCKAWQDKVAGLLPNATTTTAVNLVNASYAVQITVQWQQPGASDTQTYYTTTMVAP